MKIGAKSVLVALPKTAAYPKAAASITGNPIKPAKITPKDAPMKTMVSLPHLGIPKKG